MTKWELPKDVELEPATEEDIQRLEKELGFAIPRLAKKPMKLKLPKKDPE